MLFCFIMNPLDYEQLELTHYRSSRSEPLTETLFFLRYDFNLSKEKTSGDKFLIIVISCFILIKIRLTSYFELEQICVFLYVSFKL